MQDINALSEELIVWVQENILEKVSLERFSRCFEHYREEGAEERVGGSFKANSSQGRCIATLGPGYSPGLRI